MNDDSNIFNDITLKDDARYVAEIEQVMLRSRCQLPNLDRELEAVIARADGENDASADGADAETPVREASHRVLNIMFGALLGAAAMLAVVFVLRYVGDLHTDASPVAMNAASADGVATIQTAKGETITLTLADGTEVKLNSNSSITYPHQFRGAERMVKLTGEAFFTVRHDAQRPFIVDAGGVLTKDLGTSFNVRAYSGSDCRVTLVEGSVAVMGKQPNSKVYTLEPGQEFSLVQTAEGPASAPSVKAVDVEQTTAWADGVFYYHDQSLENIVADIAAHYQVAAVFNNQNLKHIHLDFSTSRHASLAEIVSLLNSLGVATVKAEDGKIVVE